MEYYLGDAVSQKADTLLITGAVQSNFVRIAAAACAKHGIDCHIQLENRVKKDNPLYAVSGNVLLDKLLGAVIHNYPDGEDETGADRNLETLADQLREKGKNPYVVHLHPSHPPLGALGYVDAASELHSQLKNTTADIDAIFVPSGSGNTHGGLVYGLRATGSEVTIRGICVRREKDAQHPRITERLKQIGELLDETPAATSSDVITEDDFLAPGYGVASDRVKEAMLLAAKKAALILDPVYTGKTFAALAEYSIRNPGQNLVFIHTGGAPAIFGYGEDLFPIA